MSRGVVGEFQAVRRACFDEAVADWVASRVRASEKLLCDLPGALAGGDKPQHLNFPLA